MAYRAYGQLRRGSGAWRTPFLIPIGDLVPPVIWPASYVSIDTGGPAPDLRLALIIDSFNSLNDFRLKFRIQKLAGRSVDDVTLRIVLLKSSDSLFVDSGDYHEHDVSYAVLQHRVAPGVQFPDELDLTVQVGRHIIDPAIDDPATSLVVNPATAPTTAQWCNYTQIVVHSSETDPLDMAGGLVSGDVATLVGVETDFQPDNILNPTTGSYHEDGRNIRGIDLTWLDALGPLPPSATWVAFKAINPTANPSQATVGIYLPLTGDATTGAPTVSSIAGGSLRLGTYCYRMSYLDANGNESPPGPRSAPVTIDSTAKRTVKVGAFPPVPVAPNPDVDHIAAVKVRIYRTDPDLAPTSDPDAGTRGDDVRVAELPLTATSFDDTGVYNASDPGKPGSLRPDLMVIEYSSPEHHDLTGTVRMVDGVAPVSDVTYGGSVSAAPGLLRVTYQPGTAPLLRWAADVDAGGLGIQLGTLSTPLGDGVKVDVADVPTRLAIDWSILGSEYFGLGLGAASSLDPTALTSRSVGRASARIGVLTPPTAWPAGEADNAIELLTPDGPRTGTSGAGAGSLATLSALRLALVTQGAKAWADRDANAGRMGVDARFATPTPPDRSLRVTRRSGGADALQNLDLSAHAVPDEVTAAIWMPAGESPRIELDSRVRWVRGTFRERAAPTDGTAATVIAGTVFVDDTTASLHAELGDDVTVSLDAAARLGGRVDITTEGDSDDQRLVARPDVVVPATQKAKGGMKVPSLTLTGLAAPADIEADLPEPGLGGRAAVSFGTDPPVVVRANPQVKLLTHGSAETTTGLRAASTRFIGLTNAKVPRGMVTLSPLKPAPGELPTTVHLSPGRANGSFRGEMQEREHRVSFPPDDRAMPGVRSWLRARTAHLASQVTATPALIAAGMPTGSTFGGLAVAANEAFGAGVLWAEPSAVWTDHTDELGTDKGIGLMTAGFDGIPANIELWLLEHSSDLTTRVPAGDVLPTVGPVDSSWPGGGALIRVDGSISLHHIQVATPGDASRVCRTDDGSDHPVRHGTWSEILAPFIRLDTMATGPKDLVIWSTGDASPPPDPTAPEPDPCNPPPKGPDRKTAIGWMIDPSLRASFAVRLYSLNTPSGMVTARWWSMPTSSEDWEGVDNPEPGVWHLDQELQMKDYQNTVAFYTAEDLANPFGDWQAGPGTWWLRIRDGLDAFLGSGDAYMGNVGGGYQPPLPGNNGIFSTLPRIWSWTYP